MIEHLLLDAVTRTPGTALDFAQKSGLPRRVVVEAFIRLMRASWVEIRVAKAGLEFHPTALGLVQAPLDQLPAAMVTQPKKRSFAIEQVTGGVFRSRELDLRPSYRLPSVTEDQLVVQLPGSLVPSQGDLSEVFTAIEGEDELIVGIDRSAERLLERHAVVMVREGVIEGLPGRASPDLRNLILLKAAEAVAAAQRSKQPKPASPAAVVDDVAAPVSAAELVAPVQALYDGDDLILDGAAHRTALERMLRNARRRVIIHSTFIADHAVGALYPLLLGARTPAVPEAAPCGGAIRPIEASKTAIRNGSFTSTPAVSGAGLSALHCGGSRAGKRVCEEGGCKEDRPEGRRQLD